MTAPHLALYRYGEAADLPGLSLGVTRRPPRGVKRADYRAKGYCDVWLPVLAPSKELVKAYLAGEIKFPVFARRYRAEMKKGEARQVIDLVAAMTLTGPVNLGRFCEDESRCHRSILREIVSSSRDRGRERLRQPALLDAGDRGLIPERPPISTIPTRALGGTRAGPSGRTSECTPYPDFFQS